MATKKETNVTPSDRIRGLCEHSGRSNKSLAGELGLSEPALLNYRRDRTPKAEELLGIAQFFGVTMEWLLTGIESAKPSGPSPSNLAEWKHRAIRAEEKVEMLKNGLAGLLKKI